MPSVRTILSVAGEGGGMDLVQEVGGRGRFRVVSSDHTMTFLDDSDAEEPIHGDSGWMASWEEALRKFERWPWPMLSPRHVDPAFADRVLAAIPGVLERKRIAINQYPKGRWMEACGRVKES
jgi:hypothetical protein